ncbi:hypothetical protein ACCH75_004700 [Vibrio parahaemolyticus]|uniref:hypothetical protein n=4 Tax=Vibrio parahaemolyticus TaxID=670 RepID=UPI001A190048|nr:hypothetical protein [Vibrio parahaemolyticus]EGR3456772.1 hypothetical protein [Vibrio parahaemolyticus]EIK4765284.1 hypothetical protein [Vibrio parahaemolyticus]EJE4676131.1 hypothetical protein [Vibrio parahaemolyticus]EJG1572695.1 hypothetical protein [Vibrio parahaemolyticus]HAS6573378.1 hypothetical protein [Vibrio parahaemolyticus]
MDYTHLLERIALASEAIVNGKSYYFTVAAIIASAIIGFVASNRIYRKQQKNEQEKTIETKELINFLLKKESSERWRQQIKPDLDQVFQRGSKLEVLHGYQSMELSSNDFFIIKRVSENFQSFHFIDNELVKEIIDAYMALNDFNDMSGGAQSLYSKVEDYKNALPRGAHWGTKEIESEIEKNFGEQISHYNQSAKNAVDSIDRAISKIYKHI